MRPFLLLILAAKMFAQTPPPPIVPAHSVIGDVTVDVTEIQVPTSYGQPLTQAVVSVCTGQQYAVVDISVGDTTGAIFADFQTTGTKVGLSYCSTVVAHISRSMIGNIQVGTSTRITILPPSQSPNIQTFTIKRR